MILPNKNYRTQWAKIEDSVPDNFWASYTDLMAGLLMIFALTTIVTLMDIGQKLVEPTRIVQEWKKVVEEICHDPDLGEMENVSVDCNTGALIISDEHLRFGFDKVELGQEAESVLRQAVPQYMKIISRYPTFLKRIEVIEISGHTDRQDAGNVNPMVSRQRAGQVLDFLLKAPEMKPYTKLFKSKAITAGYADTRFPSDECLYDMCKAARRVEIMIRLNDTDVLRDFLKILQQIIGDSEY